MIGDQARAQHLGARSRQRGQAIGRDVDRRDPALERGGVLGVELGRASARVHLERTDEPAPLEEVEVIERWRIVGADPLDQDALGETALVGGAGAARELDPEAGSRRQHLRERAEPLLLVGRRLLGPGKEVNRLHADFVVAAAERAGDEPEPLEGRLQGPEERGLDRASDDLPDPDARLPRSTATGTGSVMSPLGSRSSASARSIGTPTPGTTLWPRDDTPSWWITIRLSASMRAGVSVSFVASVVAPVSIAMPP